MPIKTANMTSLTSSIACQFASCGKGAVFSEESWAGLHSLLKGMQEP